MINKFCLSPLWEVSQHLAQVAGGVKPADMVITNARLVNVCTREIQPDISVAVAAGRIALVGEASFCIGRDTLVMDAGGQYLAPGFIDGHIHIESSMLSVGEYAKAVIPHGTVGVIMDPHEICNVLGLAGVKYMMEDARRAPLKTMLTAPSCVPAVPGYEDTGSSMGPKEVAEILSWDCCVALGEMMNFPGIIRAADQAHAIVAEALKVGKIATGHYSMPETGPGLNAYIAAGMRCCHESTREEDALEKMRRGMYAMLREGSASHDLRQVARAITRHEVDSRFAMLVSDDAHPHTLLDKGHMDHIIRRAIEEGVDPVTAMQMATINCAQCFHLDHELGSVSPGKCADLVFLSDLNQVKVERVVINGQVEAEQGRLCRQLAPYKYPEAALRSVRLKDPITKESFAIPAPAGVKEALVRVVEVTPAQVGTVERLARLAVRDGRLESDPDQDVLKTVVFERHHLTGTAGYGFVKGFGIRRGAMASTVAHDAHNLLVLGDNDADMALAANELIKCGGGMIVVADGRVLSLTPLPIAGLMNDLPCEEMSRLVDGLERSWAAIGCRMPSPFMTMAFIPLACLPEIRLTNRGLVDCRSFTFADLVVEE